MLVMNTWYCAEVRLTAVTIYYDDVKITGTYNDPVGAGATPLP